MASTPRRVLDEQALASSHLRALVKDSGLSREVISRRGYRTVRTKAELKQLGFAASQHLVPTLLLPIWGVTGEIVGYQSRPDRPRIVKDKPVKYETPTKMRMALDVHPSVRDLLRDPAVPLYVTEGMKKGDALVSRGACAVALLGVWNWRGTNDLGGRTALADWEQVALNGRRVLVVFDSDVMLKPEVHSALARLKAFLEGRGADVYAIYLPSGPNGVKQGVDDFLAGGADLNQLLALATPALLPSPTADAGEEDDDEGASMATIMVQIALSADLFHDEKRDAYAAVFVDGHRETWPVRSSDFKRWLAQSFYLKTDKAPKSASISDAMTVVEAKAQFDGELRRVWTRTALGADGCIYLDLGDETWRGVRLAPSGWTVVDGPPAHFVRGPASAPLPLPERGGSLQDLRNIVNFGGDDDYYRVVGWLVGALRPQGPYPVLAFVAEQGSGKSAAARYLRSLVDPSAIPVRGMPREERDLVIAARANHVVAFDNVSNISAWLSDAFCRMATGGGWATRRLYTDAEEEIFKQSRPLLINGIEDYITAPDLLDRAMLVNLPTISPDERRQEKDLNREFDRLQPLLLGALLDAVCAALRNIETVELSAFPRMADFAAWVVAAEPALGWPAGTFLNAYIAGATEAQDVVLEASLVGEPLRAMVEVMGEWEGTSSELLGTLAARVSEEVRRGKTWPKTARALSGAVRRIAPTLRSFGIEVSFTRMQTSARKRLISLQARSQEATVQTVRPSTQTRTGLDGGAAPPSNPDGPTAVPSTQPPIRMDGVNDVDGASPCLQPQARDLETAWEVEIKA